MITAIPGPKARALLARKQLHVPRGPFNAVQTFAAKAEGALVTDVDGNTFIDFAGAIGTLNVGHRPREVVAALEQQMNQYLHTCFHVMMYEPYVQLAETLNKITPGEHKKKTFFLSSGAEAVENAVKIARKYTGRKGIISFERGFHGRTFMSMSLTSKVKPYKYEFGPFAPETYKWPYPYYFHSSLTPQELDDRILKQFQIFFLSEVPAEDIAAVIMEPVQGEGGFVIPSAYFVQQVKIICEKHHILFISDEIQTGFGRTGKMFGIEHFGVVPDIITMSKSLGAGIPISAVTAREEVIDAANPGEIGGTYGGSPLGCAAALEVIKIINQKELLKRSLEIGNAFKQKFRLMQMQCKQLGEVRQLGAMCALEFIKDPVTKEPNKELVTEILEKAHQRGLIIMSAGLYGNIIRLLMPLVITDEQLQEGFDVLADIILECCTEKG